MRFSGTISVRFNFAVEKVAILLGFLQPCRFQVPSSAPENDFNNNFFSI